MGKEHNLQNGIKLNKRKAKMKTSFLIDGHHL